MRRRALVIGSGIAGPALGLFLARAGLDVTVFEAYPRRDEVGGGFQLAPNGMRVLAELGLDRALIAAGTVSSGMAFRNHHGHEIGLVRTRASVPAVNLSRPTVLRALRDELVRRGVAIHYERGLADVATSGPAVTATFEGGSTATGDLLLGADGVHSRVRGWMFPAHPLPRDTEMVAIGGLCAPGTSLPGDPRDAGRLTFMMGSKYQLGYSRFGDGQWAWWCHMFAPGAERTAVLAMSAAELRTAMLERYAGWAEPVGSLIRGTVSWVRTPIYDVPTLPSWHRGPVVLIGDAAHAMSPAGGQGASLALEDARLLAHLVGDASLPLATALAQFEVRSRPRAEAMVAQAYANDRRTLKEIGPVAQWTRDHVMMPVFARVIARTLNEVYAYDATA